MEKVARPSWDEFFMGFARQSALRATCPRKSVGAVIVKDSRVISTGYNGSIPGVPHCIDTGCLMMFDVDRGMESCVRTVHAEANAIVQAATLGGVSTAGATIYTTASPCWPCFKLIASARISRIVFAELYRDERIFQFAREAGIELCHLVV